VGPTPHWETAGVLAGARRYVCPRNCSPAGLRVNLRRRQGGISPSQRSGWARRRWDGLVRDRGTLTPRRAGERAGPGRRDTGHSAMFRGQHWRRCRWSTAFSARGEPVGPRWRPVLGVSGSPNAAREARGSRQTIKPFRRGSRSILWFPADLDGEERMAGAVCFGDRSPEDESQGRLGQAGVGNRRTCDRTRGPNVVTRIHKC